MTDSLQALEERLESVEGGELVELLIELSLRTCKISPTRACHYAEEALAKAISIGSKLMEADSLEALGRANLGKLTHDQALEHFHSALSIYEELGSKKGIAGVLGCIGQVHYSLGESEAALEYLERSRRLLKELDDRKRLARNLNSTGLVLLGSDKHEEALKYLEESLAAATLENDIETIRSATNNTGIIHYQNDNFKEAIVFFKKAALLSEQCGDLRSLAGNLINIGTGSIRLGDYDEAHEYLNKGFGIAEQSEAWDYMIQGSYSLCELCEKEGDFEKALEHHRRMSELEKKLFTIQKTRATAEIEARYEIQKAEQGAEIHRLRNIELVEKNRLIDAQAEVLRRINEDLNYHREKLSEKNRELESLLKEKEDFLSRMIEHISDGVMIDDQSGRIVYANDRFLQIFGFSRSDLQTMDPFITIAPEWRERVRDYHARRLAGEDIPDRFEFEGLKKDGERIWLEVGVAIVEREGVKQGTQSLVRDITGRKILEARLLQSQKLDAVGRLAGGIAHDFNNLLTVIKGHSEFILGGIAEDDPLRSDAEEINKAADRASVLTRQLLAFSRQQILQPKILDLRRVVSGLQKMLSRLLGEDIHLAVSFAQDAGCVMADESQIEQVILNLVINARDAMESGGELVIDVDNVNIDAQSLVINPDLHPGQWVKLSIMDSGCGMNADTQSRIFEPFFSTKMSENGSGLGLAMVYGIVRQSDGVIEVSSEPGVGTTFNVLLPRVHGDQTPEEVQVVRVAEPGRGESILLVEDDDSLRSIAEDYLSREGYEIISVASAEDALELSKNTVDRIQLLLTDIVLPGVSGVDLAVKLREDGFEGRILFITGYAKKTALPADLQKGAREILHKPFSLSTLSRRIRELMDSVQDI